MLALVLAWYTAIWIEEVETVWTVVSDGSNSIHWLRKGCYKWSCGRRG
jgi:hypothetical protein